MILVLVYLHSLGNVDQVKLSIYLSQIVFMMIYILWLGNRRLLLADWM